MLLALLQNQYDVVISDMYLGTGNGIGYIWPGSVLDGLDVLAFAQQFQNNRATTIVCGGGFGYQQIQKIRIEPTDFHHAFKAPDQVPELIEVLQALFV